MTYRITIRVLALLSFLTFHHGSAGAETRELLLAAYSVPKEAYEKRINPAFEQFWKQKTGESISHSQFILRHPAPKPAPSSVDWTRISPHCHWRATYSN